MQQLTFGELLKLFGDYLRTLNPFEYIWSLFPQTFTQYITFLLYLMCFVVVAFGMEDIYRHFTLKKRN